MGYSAASSGNILLQRVVVISYLQRVVATQKNAVPIYFVAES